MASVGKVQNGYPLLKRPNIATILHLSGGDPPLPKLSVRKTAFHLQKQKVTSQRKQQSGHENEMLSSAILTFY
jgi:hypothetical protein